MLTIENAIQSFNQYLDKASIPKNPSNLYEPVSYMMSLGGKRLRPALLLISGSMFGNLNDSAYKLALAVEWFHNFTLMHDDIMDNADLRRGKTTVWKKYDLNTGILSGDVMLLQAFQYINSIEDKEKLPAILTAFNKAATLVCEGQQEDIDYEKRNDVNADEYLSMIGKKTAALLACSLQMGAMINSAEDFVAKALYDFGWNLGVAFQLKDDYLDAYGDPEKFGKKKGGDILMNKKTFLLIKAQELAKGKNESLLNKMLKITDDSDEKIEEILDLYDKLNIEKITRETIL
ncbi:MAG: polyprenyl synthetase family protein, partial [Chitinophagaceae bacterium]